VETPPRSTITSRAFCVLSTFGLSVSKRPDSNPSHSGSSLP
jgi:hypothetical protein